MMMMIEEIIDSKYKLSIIKSEINLVHVISILRSTNVIPYIY